ncbi:hypothetical protein BGZ76_009119 [Entomortierella beljakovae]|nr:hypothetical protein BGZ76_009119 [Entomortierella beljakovae]
MDTWPGTLVYQPTQDQAPCACNQNYYDQMGSCLKCQTSTTATYSVKDLAGYQLVCQSFHQTWKEINLPNATTTTTTTTTATSTNVSPSLTDPNSDGLINGSDDGLSSGAIAGIVVSIIALIVALSVAVYVWGRRKRESVQDVADLEEFKYRDTHSDSYMEAALPQYTGMIQSPLPPISKVSNLRVMNPDSDDDELSGVLNNNRRNNPNQPSFEVQRNNSPGWRRGSFDDD